MPQDKTRKILTRLQALLEAGGEEHMVSLVNEALDGSQADLDEFLVSNRMDELARIRTHTLA